MATPRKPEDRSKAKFLVHAPAGSGKTHFLGTAQDDDRTFPMAFINWDSGEETLSGLDIDVFDIRDSRDYEDVYKDLSTGKTGHKSVGVDSVSEMQINTLSEILQRDLNRADPDQLAMQDWGIALIRMRRIIRQFAKMLPMHVFMTALSKETTIARVGTVKVPALQGQFADELPGIMGSVGYLAQEEDENEPEGFKRIMLMHSNPRFLIKARSPWGKTVPAEIEKPNITKVMDALGFNK